MNIIRKNYQVCGQVQGVGFRPTLAVLARDLGLGGWVRNCGDHVELEIVGTQGEIDSLLTQLPLRLPHQARIDTLTEISSQFVESSAAPQHFEILDSQATSSLNLSFPADAAMCGDCLAEVNDTTSRRFRYPFTTCARCGPRFTVIESIPYDRERTSMRSFPKCAACQAEYDDPTDRRFHAETIACPKCGPTLRLIDEKNNSISGDPLLNARAALRNGQILALRGIGGFQLAVDPRNSDALARLRKAKNRPAKPLAVMSSSIDVVRRYCEVSEDEERLLKSSAAPIVLLNLKSTRPQDLLTDLLCPDTKSLGVMLANSPLHSLLLQPSADQQGFDFLVMTSGNRRSEPICISNEEALDRLHGIADLFLIHNREIALRADDSVVTINATQDQIWRRARGYVPVAIRTPVRLERQVLAMGAELKNTISCGTDWGINSSPHVGDLETPEALHMLESLVDSFPRHLKIQPQVVAVDLHPDFHSTRIGKAYAAKHGLEVVQVQHHFAHAAAAMVDHGLTRCLALVFDGTGFGTDESIWGGELLAVNQEGFHRLGTFKSAPLPGGDAAVRSPIRQLFGRAAVLGANLPPSLLKQYEVSDEESATWQTQIKRRINCPPSHAVGRLFDSFSAALGIAPSTTSYEGQAAVKLETLARHHNSFEPHPALRFDYYEDNGLFVVDWSKVFNNILGSPPDSNEIEKFSAGFHFSLTEASLRLIEYGQARIGACPVVVSGGVFCNNLLTELLKDRSRSKGIELLIHKKIPPNDGGISVGQAFVTGMGYRN